MNPGEYTVRRATVDDVKSLLKLWESAGLPGIELERRLTEFQVVVDSNETIVAAMGLQIEAKNGKVHSEAFSDPALKDTLRPRLWDRMLIVAKNIGLFGMSTLERGQFW